MTPFYTFLRFFMMQRYTFLRFPASFLLKNYNKRCFFSVDFMRNLVIWLSFAWSFSISDSVI